MIELIKQYIEAREVERKAIEKRVELAEKIANKLGKKDEGQVTHELDGYKITVKQPMNRKVDWQKFNEISFGKGHIPSKLKQELDEPGLKWVRENEPEYYKQLCEAITSKPGRVAVEVKEIEQ